MSKGLEALKGIKILVNKTKLTVIDCALLGKRYDIIEKELKRLEELEKAFVALSKDDEKAKKLLSKEIEKNRVLEIIKSRGIILRIPENDYSKEHFDIHIYTNTMSFEEICKFEEIML